MEINLDKIGFGNPSKRDHLIMKQECYLDKIIPGLRKYSPPPNSSRAVKSEIEQLVQLSKEKVSEKDVLFDNTLLVAIKNMFIQSGADENFVDTVIKSVGEDVVPVVTKLKYFFNRPRPAQLSWLLGINLFPSFSYFTNSPSYPSGHTCLTVVTCNVLGNLYPESFKAMDKIVKEVKSSRLYLGVHYASDNDMSMLVAKTILDCPEFKVKYSL